MKSAGHINSVYCCQFALPRAFLIYLFGVQRYSITLTMFAPADMLRANNSIPCNICLHMDHISEHLISCLSCGPAGQSFIITSSDHPDGLFPIKAPYIGWLATWLADWEKCSPLTGFAFPNLKL